MPLLHRFSGALDSVTRGWLTLLVGDLGRIILGFGVSILITRSLGPAHFGIYTLLGTITGLAGVLADAGLSQAATRYLAPAWQRHSPQARLRGQAFFWLRLTLALIVAGLGLLLARPLTALFGLPSLAGAPASSLLALALGGVVAGALSGANATLLQGTGRFRPIAITLIFNTGLTLLLALALTLMGWLNLLTALLLLGIVPSLATFLLGIRLLPDHWTLRPPSWRYLRRAAGPFVRFGRWLWLANLLAMLALQLDILLLNHLSQAAVVGVYGLALSLASKLDIVNRSLYTVLLPAASALSQGDEYRRYLRQGLLRSSLILLLLLPAIPLARPFILFFYGADYAATVFPFHLLLLAVVLDTLALPLSLLAFPLNRPQWLAATNVVQILALLLAALVLIPAAGAPGAALARVIARALGLALTLLLLVRYRLAGPKL